MKTINWLFSAACAGSLCFGMAACSGNDDNDGKTSVESYLLGKRWFKDGNKNTEYSFYRNHLVVSDGGASVTSGGLTSGDSNFFGTWQVVGDKLTTTFTSGSYSGFDWNNILYGTLTVNKLYTNTDQLDCTDTEGKSHVLEHYEQSGSSKRTFTDYTDTSIHDNALVGTWHATAYSNNQPVEYTITVNKNGTVRWQQSDNEIDFTSSFTTKNGNVDIDHILVPNSQSASFIYIREDDRVLFYDKSNAILVWRWQK